MLLHKNQIIPLDITDVTALGNGIGRYVSEEYPDGFVVFVPLTAVGDRIDCKIVKVEKKYAYGIIEHINSYSKDRIDNDTCPVYSKCGGCAWRHVSYEAELQYKQRHVEDCINKIGGIDHKVEPIIGSTFIDKYRNKAQYPVSKENNELKIGFYASRSHRIIDCRNCNLQPDIFTEILSDISDWITKYNISVYDEKVHKGLLKHIYLRQGYHSKEIMVCLVTTKQNVPKLEELKEILLNYDDIKSIILNINPKQTNVILGDQEIVVYGTNKIEDSLCNVSLNIASKAFYQVNTCQAETLYKKAAELLDPVGNEIIIDLYCGTGSIGLSMANRIKKLIGVDIVEDSIINAKENAFKNNIDNAEFICADASNAAKIIKKDGIKPDAVIIDPPRKGCDEALLTTLVEMNPNKIVYISCNPSTLARDLNYLKDFYDIKCICPFDMFPRTIHVESVVLLTKVHNE